MARCFAAGVAIILTLAITSNGVAAVIAIPLTKLSGLTGGTIANTAVYRADLSSISISSILSIGITDNSFGLGGAGGQFSGFDLDAILLSNTSVSSASDAQALTGLAVFDFSTASTFFTPGAQRVPVDPKLFGTDAGGANVNNLVATLGAFDGESTTAIPGADGFLSMGDGGQLNFNLTSAISTSNLFLYLGEVGDNGEVAAGSIFVSDTSIGTVPEPSSLVTFGLGACCFALKWAGRGRRQRIAVANNVPVHGSRTVEPV